MKPVLIGFLDVRQIARVAAVPRIICFGAYSSETESGAVFGGAFQRPPPSDFTKGDTTMTTLGRTLIGAVAFIAASLISAVALAQQVTGTPGSPGATTTVSNKQLPPPDPKFGGVIKNDALRSKPWWAPRVDK